jgi:N-acetylmuramoyl-L-alanine amidase
VARRLRAAVEGRLGIRVVLTRDDDRAVPLETRAAIANNNKADLFLSLHANASFRRTAAGASLLYASFEPEVEAAGTARRSERVPAMGGGFREIDLVSWDAAQLGHVARSADLARTLADEFRDRIPLSPHPVERAPLEVLRSVNMPAVMVEMGYLSNDDQERLLADAGFQNTLVQAMYDAILRFRGAPPAGAQ